MIVSLNSLSLFFLIYTFVPILDVQLYFIIPKPGAFIHAKCHPPVTVMTELILETYF